MKFFVVAATLVACSLAAPAYPAGVAVADVPAGPAVAATYAAGPPVAHVHESYHAGPAIAKTFVEHGVVGHRTVQVGSQAVQVGAEPFIAAQEVHQPSPYSYVAGEAINTQQTVALPPPALPVAAAAPYAAIPPAPRNLGPAPADTVTQEIVAAPVRTHTRITPRVTNIEPQLQVNQVPYDVPVQVPVPVHREVLVKQTVQKPYAVEVPRAVPVAAPYKVHPVHEVVETPVINEHTVSVHQPAVAYAAAPAVAVAHAAPAVVAKHY